MGKLKIGTRVRDDDGDEGVIVGKAKGERLVKYDDVWAGQLWQSKSSLTVLAATPASACAEVCETEYKVGDRVRMVRDNTNGGPEYGAKGEEFEVASPDGGWDSSDELRIKHPGHSFDPAVSFRDIQPVVAPATTEWVPAVGERVVFTADNPNGGSPYGTAGQEAIITELLDYDDDQGHGKQVRIGDTGCGFDPSAPLCVLRPILPVAEQPAGGDAWVPKVGDRVRLKPGNEEVIDQWNRSWSSSGLVATMDTEFVVNDYRRGYHFGNAGIELATDTGFVGPWWFASRFSPAPTTPTTWAPIAGKFGKTRDGRKVGPMRRGNSDSPGFYWVAPETESGFGSAWHQDGAFHPKDSPYWTERSYAFDLIAEWSDDAPVAVAEATATFALKVGDRVVCVKPYEGAFTVGREYTVAYYDADLDQPRLGVTEADHGRPDGIGVEYFTPATPAPKFKVGDRVENVCDHDMSITIGGVYVVTKAYADGFFEFDDDDGDNRYRHSDEYKLAGPATPTLPKGTLVTLTTTGKVTGQFNDNINVVFPGLPAGRNSFALPASVLVAA